jgi:hypothetical protein
MKQYAVTISATVTKEITVTAENEKQASDEANRIFCLKEDLWPEKYEQDTHSVKELLEDDLPF